ncbi:hypothetical protein BJ742DRAFT_835582 [Cladochytrium replicatum]|nr:hypothetical protein BJ742DRAFT_835582 [Cladochytrium replicatum]
MRSNILALIAAILLCAVSTSAAPALVKDLAPRAVANNANGAPFFGIPTAFEQSQITVAKLEDLYRRLLQVSKNAETLSKQLLAQAKAKQFQTVTGEGVSAESVSSLPASSGITTFGNSANFKKYFDNVFVVIRREDLFVAAEGKAKSTAEKNDLQLRLVKEFDCRNEQLVDLLIFLCRLFSNKVMKLAGFLNQNVITLATKLTANPKADITKQIADQKDGLTKINNTIKELQKLQSLRAQGKF